MDFTQLELNPRIISAARKANLRSARDILSLSGADLQRSTRLSVPDVQRLQAAVAVAYRKSPPVTALQLYRGECPALEPHHRLSLGCPALDRLMRGGIPLRGITELAGESGAGKTQIGLQLCLTVQYPQVHGGLASGAVYICTEDTFPIKRLHQLVTQQPRLRPELPKDLIRGLCFSDNIYIEHAADLGVLQTCLSQRVPILLARGLARLVVLDSVAALFRCEFTPEESSERGRHLMALARTLQCLSDSFSAPVLCINQVTDVVDASQFHFGLVESPVLPALGMAWANRLLVRLMMRRLGSVPSPGARISAPRTLEVMFAPHLPRVACLCRISEEGVRGELSPDPAHIISSSL